MSVLNYQSIQIDRILKVALAASTIALLAYFFSTTNSAYIIDICQKNGVPITKGLAEALSTISTVYGVQSAFLAYMGVAIGWPVAALIAGVGAVGL
ncbi:hypothetical protein [Bacillus sp. TL12]|uniref:hypothetical protein n=1 Tax=Bacillus sp. TL12 TaxID=2894756 RepID=UPI001F51DD15|nr:hypothetical protein [Bacillus sp. TL12]MCI0768160.1 hypothetical protein [Bacillus sp. TL12]